MNITGAKMYNSEVGAMRNASNNTDVIKRLVFVYPFGIDQSLANLPFNTFVKGDNDTVGDALRSFFSISVLKEIFTSNALNLVTMASTYEKKKKETNNTSLALINNLLRGDNNGGYTYGGYDLYNSSSSIDMEYPDVDPTVLQNKITEKFEKIKQMMKSDPKLKKLLPFMEVITLRNMIDVPVITGTFPFQLDTGSLFTLLAGAIATRTKLDSWPSVKQVISRIKSMPDLSVYQIFNVLSNVEKNNNVPTTIRNLELPGGNQINKIDELNSRLNNGGLTDKQKENILSDIDFEKNAYAIEYISNLKDTKMKELERNLMFMMDPERLVLRYGLNIDMSQATYASKKVNPQTELLFSRTKQQFIEFLGGADSIFSSTYMLLSPIVPTDPRWGETYLSMKDKLMNFVYENFDVFMRDLKSYFTTSITKDIEASSLSISNMNKSCLSAKEDFTSAMNLFNKTMSGNQVFPTFSMEDLKNFSNAIDTVVGKFKQIKKNTEDSLTQFFGNDNMRQINSSLDNLISNSFDSFFTKFNLTGDPDSQLQARIFAIEYDQNGYDLNDPNNPVKQRRKAMHQKFLMSLAEATKIITQTVFLMIFKLNLCDFVEVADVEFEVAKTDVLDLPNYCLVLPLEILQALFILYTKRQWKDAVIKSGAGFNPLNGSNIKHAVKMFRTQLGIPNLIVFDKKKKELYYSFRYLGNAAEKIKLQSLETFVKQYLQDKKSGISQVYY